MPTNPGVSEVQDKNGVVADIEAKRFDGTRTVQIQGDVTATQTWNGDSNTALTLNASIGAKKVTQDKIGDKAVGSGQMADGSVGLPQMDPNAITSSAIDGDDRLITSGGVRTEIDNAILNRGKDYGPMTPTQINAITGTIPTGSTVHVTEAGTITDGDIVVRAGEDLRYYSGNGEHYWYSLDGDFKLKQNAKSSPTASGNTLEFIDSITQDENGEITATKKAVQDGTTSQKGVVQLEDSHSSTSTTKAATPNSVKEAYDLANTANTGLANKLDKTGNGKDVTATFTEASARANIGTGEKLSVMFGKIKKWFSDLKALAFKDTVSDSDISGTISDNHIASASTWNGKADKVSGATNGNLAALDSNGNLTDSGNKASDFELVTNKVRRWQTTPDDTHYPSEKLVKDGLGAKADANKVVAIADAMIKRIGQAGSGWYKLAERPNTSLYDNVNYCFDVYAATDSNKFAGRLDVAVRTGNSAGASVGVSLKKFYSDAWISDYKFKIVIRGLTGSANIELWASCLRDFGGLSISERNTSSYTANNKKDGWTYTSYENNGGSAAPVTDETNNVKVFDVDVVYRQHAITSPTNDNLVAMDEMGLVKDSGLTKSSVESAISSAGSAIQGVKVNNTTLTPDANKVVTVPLATTSADGAMSAADKTKLNNAATYTQSSGTAPVKVDEYGALTPVPMDSTPTASSTNLMTSGAIKTALDGKQDSLSFMNDSEAVAIWNDAKTAAANAS